MTIINRSIKESIRQYSTWNEKWKGEDQGLIACWEKGREKALEDPALATKARAGQLVILPWRGGVKKKLKKKQKYGSYYYLAMWQGLRGEDLRIDTDEEFMLTCTRTGMAVIFTSDPTKYKDEEEESGS